MKVLLILALSVSLARVPAHAGTVTCGTTGLTSVSCGNSGGSGSATPDLSQRILDEAFKGLEQSASPLGTRLGQLISGSTDDGSAKLGSKVGSNFGKVLDGIFGTSFLSHVFDFIGSFIGGIFGGGRGKPYGMAWVEYDGATNSFHVTQRAADNGAPVAPAVAMAQQAADSLNALLSASGGRVAARPPIFGFGFQDYGYFWAVSPENATFATHISGDTATALNQGILALLRGLQIEGGDLAVVGAIKNTRATTVADLGNEIELVLKDEILELARQAIAAAPLPAAGVIGSLATPATELAVSAFSPDPQSSAVPEPGTILLFGLGLAGLGLLRRRRAAA